MISWFVEKRTECIESGYADGVYITILCSAILLDIIGIAFCQTTLLQICEDSARLAWVMRLMIMLQIGCIIACLVELIKIKLDWYLD